MSRSGSFLAVPFIGFETWRHSINFPFTFVNLNFLRGSSGVAV